MVLGDEAAYKGRDFGMLRDAYPSRYVGYDLTGACFRIEALVGIDAVFGLIMGIITGSSVLEAIVALVLVTGIGKVLLHVPYLRPSAQASKN